MPRIWLVVHVLLLLLAACAAPKGRSARPQSPDEQVKSSPLPERPDADEVQNYPHLTLWQRSLRTELGFQDPVVLRRPDGLIQVTLSLLGRGEHTVRIEYKVVWLDDRGRAVGPDMAWVPVAFEPGQQFNLISSIHASEVTDFTFHLRRSAR